MSDELTIEEQEQKLLDEEVEEITNLLCELEEKMLRAGIKLTDAETSAMKSAQMKLAEHRKAEKVYIDKVLQQGIDDGSLVAVPGGVIDTPEKKEK